MVIDIVERQGLYEIVCLVQEGSVPAGRLQLGYPVLGMTDGLAPLPGASCHALIAIGDNAKRMRVAAALKQQGWQFTSAIHPAAALGREVRIGAGSVVMAGCAINPGSVVGEHVIVNTGATVDHDCNIGDGVHLAPGCHLCGGVSVGSGSFLGAGTVAIPGVRIGRNVITGAGSSVVGDIADAVKVAGVPAKPIEQS